MQDSHAKRVIIVYTNFQALFDREECSRDPFFDRLRFLLAQKSRELLHVSLVLVGLASVLHPVLHGDLNLLLILRDKVLEIVHLLDRVLTELIHD